MTPEGKVKELIKKFLKKYDITYWMVVPGPYGRATGFADFTCILPISGRWLAIEAKAPTKKDTVTNNQRAFLDSIESNGGIAVVVSCQEDLDALEKRLYG